MRYSFQNAKWRANVLLWVTVGVTTRQLVFFLFHVNPFHSWEIVPPWKSNKIPMKLSHMENQTKIQWNCPTLKIKQKSNVRVIGSLCQRSRSFQLLSLSFHDNRACYWLLSLLFHDYDDNRASHSWNTIWPWKFKVKGQGQRHPSQHSTQLTHFLSVWHQVILSTPVPFIPWHLGLPFPRYNLTLKVKGQGQRYPNQRSIQLTHFLSISHEGNLSTPVFFILWQSSLSFPRYNLTLKVKGQGQRYQISAVSSRLISLVFHIRASYRLLSLSFRDNRASHSWYIIWPWKLKVKVKVKGILVSVASSWLISFSFTSIGPTIPKIWQIECWTGEKRIWNFTKKIAKKTFWQNSSKI